jgi:hypothetical protein
VVVLDVTICTGRIFGLDLWIAHKDYRRNIATNSEEVSAATLRMDGKFAYSTYSTVITHIYPIVLICIS